MTKILKIFIVASAIASGALLVVWGVAWTALGPMPATGGLPMWVECGGPSFAQGDPRWAGDLLGSTSDTLADSGCAVASAAMALSARGASINPGALNAFLTRLPGGYTPEGWIYWEKAVEFFPSLAGEFRPHYEDAPSFFLVDANLLRGNPVIARLRLADGRTHFVLICGKRGFGYLVRDPAEPAESAPICLADLPGPVEAIRFYALPR